MSLHLYNTIPRQTNQNLINLMFISTMKRILIKLENCLMENTNMEKEIEEKLKELLDKIN